MGSLAQTTGRHPLTWTGDAAVAPAPTPCLAACPLRPPFPQPSHPLSPLNGGAPPCLAASAPLSLPFPQPGHPLSPLNGYAPAPAPCLAATSPSELRPFPSPATRSHLEWRCPALSCSGLGTRQVRRARRMAHRRFAGRVVGAIESPMPARKVPVGPAGAQPRLAGGALLLCLLYQQLALLITLGLERPASARGAQHACGGEKERTTPLGVSEGKVQSTGKPASTPCRCEQPCGGESGRTSQQALAWLTSGCERLLKLASVE